MCQSCDSYQTWCACFVSVKSVRECKYCVRECRAIAYTRIRLLRTIAIAHVHLNSSPCSYIIRKAFFTLTPFLLPTFCINRWRCAYTRSSIVVTIGGASGTTDGASNTGECTNSGGTMKIQINGTALTYGVWQGDTACWVKASVACV